MTTEAFKSLPQNVQWQIRLDEAKTLEEKLTICLAARNLQGIGYFLAKGANPNGLADYALDNPEAMMLLLAYGADQNAQGSGGRTMLHNIYMRYILSTMPGQDEDRGPKRERWLEVVRILAQNDADFNLLDGTGCTPEQLITKLCNGEPERAHLAKTKLAAAVQQGKSIKHANEMDGKYGKPVGTLRKGLAILQPLLTPEEIAETRQKKGVDVRLSDMPTSTEQYVANADMLSGATHTALPLSECRTRNEAEVTAASTSFRFPLTTNERLALYQFKIKFPTYSYSRTEQKNIAKLLAERGLYPKSEQQEAAAKEPMTYAPN